MKRILALLLLTGTQSHALDCTNPTVDLQEAICADTALSDLAILADDVGKAVGLDINYDNFDVLYEIYPRFTRLLRTLTIADVDNLNTTIPGWVSFSAEHKVLIINADGSPLQNMLVTFGRDDRAAYVNVPPHDDAGRYYYLLDDDILEITESFRPAQFIRKYRAQNGCWRLIGEDATWRDEDPTAHSINFLTGQAIIDYKDGTTVTKTFDTSISCIGDDFYSYTIDYHAD